MKSETPYKNQLSTKQTASRVTWLWIGGSGIGALVGAVLALTFYPSAAFGRNPTGQFGWHLVGFALAIGIPFAISQWLILCYVLRYRKRVNIPFLVLWIPVTSIGIAFMILPLWWWDAEVFFFAPWYVGVPMLPGMLFLGLCQWFILYRAISARIIWVLFTILGAVTGAVLGLVASFVLFPLPPEATWAFVTGASIGALQRSVLVSGLDADLRRQEQSS